MFKTKNIQVKQFLKNRNFFIIFLNREIIFSRYVSRLFFPHYIVLFVILCDGCFFTAEKKGEKRDVSNNKLYQILSRVYTSVQNRRFMSQARRTRHFGRSARRGKEKNKAAVTSPLFWFLLCRLCLYLTEKCV